MTTVSSVPETAIEVSSFPSFRGLDRLPLCMAGMLHHRVWSEARKISEFPRDPWRVLAYALVVTSAFSGSLGKMFGLSVRPDWCLAGTTALLLLLTRPWKSAGEWRRQLRGPIALGIGVFVAVHLATSVVNAGRWPAGLRFMTVYVFGLAAFLAMLQGIRSRPALDVAVRLLIGISVVASVLGGLAAIVSNLLQRTIVGASPIYYYLDVVPIHAGRAGLVEPNILGSFLLAPFALALWGWSDQPASRFPFRAASLVIVSGFVIAQTRAAWLCAAVIVLAWLSLRRPPLLAPASMVCVAAVSFLALQISLLPLTWGRSALDQPVPAQPSSGQTTPDPAPSAQPSSGQTAMGPPAASALSSGPGEPGSASVTGAPDRPHQWDGPPASTNLIQLRATDTLVHGVDYNLRVRWMINRAVLDDWRAGGPLAWLLGRGSGSTNEIEFVLRVDRWDRRLERLWTGNAFLMTLHDAGLVGLAAFTVLLGGVAYQLRSMFGRARTRRDRGLCQALSISALGLIFAYQFTHALWQMWTYVFLGLIVVASRVLATDEAQIESPSH